MCDGKGGGLLRKGERNFPDQNDGRIDKNRKRPVLKFAGEITADPRVGTEQRKMTLVPTACDIGEHGQDRQFIVVIPKNQRVVPEKEKAKRGDDKAGCDGAEEIFSQSTTGLPSVMTSTLS